MKRIMKLEDSDNYILYRTACKCDDTDCDLTIMLDTDFNEVSIVFYKKLYVTTYKSNFFLRMFERFRLSLRLIFTGYLEEESDFIFKGEAHIKDLLDALNSGLIQLQKPKK